MLSLVGLFSGSYLKYMVAAIFALTILAWAINDITSPYRREISRLKSETQALARANAQKDAQIEDDQRRAEEDRQKAEKLDAEINNVVHSQPADSDCRLSDQQLRVLRSIASR